MTGWVHQRCDEKLFTDINKTKHKLSAHFQWGDNYTNLSWLNKLSEKTIQMEKWIYLSLRLPTMHCFLITKKMEEKLFEFGLELLWISLYFWQPNTITLKSMDRDAYQVHINSLGINRLTRFCILCFEIATQDAKSWICECHQPEFLWRLSDKCARLED